MHGRPIPGALTLAAALAAMLAAAEPGRSEDSPAPGTPKADAPLRFIRVYAPADRIEDWPRRDGRFVPMEPSEFERRVRLVEAAPGVAVAPAVGVASAEYRARLVGDQLVDGEATLQVFRRGQGRASLSLEPCGLAIRNPRWGADEESPAALGLGANGQVAVLVRQPGRLRFDWTLAGRRDPAGVLHFEVALPVCPRNRLTLDAPDRLTPVADSEAIVSRRGRNDDGTWRWTVEVPAGRSLRLRLVPAEISAQHRQLVLVRQATVYDFRLSALELSARFQLDVHNEPLEELVLSIDRRLKPISVRVGEEDLPFVHAEGADGARDRLVVRLSEPLHGTGRVLRVTARAPLRIGSAWRLPTICPNDVAWQEGSLSLVVPSQLVIEQLTTEGCRQTRAEPLAGPRSGESVELQAFSPHANVEVVLGRARPPLLADVGTSVELSPRDVSAAARIRLHAGEGEHFRFEAQVARRWLVDSVDSRPPAAVEDWNVERVGKGPGKLVVRLARPVTASQPVTLDVAARRLQYPLGTTIRAEEVVPLRLADGRVGRQLVEFRSGGAALEIVSAGSGTPSRIDPDSLDQSAFDLFDHLPEGLLFESDTAIDRLELTLEARKPRFVVESKVEVLVGHDRLTESWRTTCTPQSTRVDRVVVVLSHPRSEAIAWSLGDDRTRQLEATRVSAEVKAREGLPAECEAWEIVLQPSRSGPFEIRGQRTSTWSDEEPLALVAVPDAASQKATVQVRQESDSRVRVANHRLTPIPPEPMPDDPAAPLLGAYRYDAMRDAMPQDIPAIAIRRAGGSDGMADLWVWDCRLQSRFGADGAGRHVAAYRIQNVHSHRFSLRLPSGVSASQVTSLTVDGIPARWSGRSEDSTGHVFVTVPLSTGTRFPTVAIHFQTSGQPLTRQVELEAPLPLPAGEALSARWTVWLPPGFRAARAAADWRAQPRVASPVELLFGPLARPAGRPRFDPLAVEAWVAIARPGLPREEAKRRAARVLQVLGRRDHAEKNARPCWKDVLGREALAGVDCALLVDRYGLGDLGIDPRSALPDSGENDLTRRGADLLRRADLAVLLDDEAALLTTATTAAVHRKALEPLGGEVVWRVRPGPLSEALRHAARSKSDTVFVPVANWLECGPQARLPWGEPGTLGCRSGDSPGWTATRMEIPVGETTRLRVIAGGPVKAMGWTVFLAAASVACWVASRPRLLALALGALAATSFLIDGPHAPLLSAAFLGVAAGLVAWLLRAGLPSRRAAAKGTGLADRSDGGVTSAAGRGVAGAVVFLLLATIQGAGQDVAPDAGKPTAGVPAPRDTASPGARPAPLPDVSAPLYRVFIPVDAQQRPTGDRYQVPEPLYQELRRRERKATRSPQGWLLHEATYRGELSKDAASGGLIPTELTALFELEILDAGESVVALPLSREGTNLEPGGAKLDGRAIEPEWTKDGSALLVPIPDAVRTARLQLAVRPPVRDHGASRGFDLVIPRVPRARLEFLVPVGTSGLEVPSARGAVVLEDEPSPRLVADLGPAGRLAVRWPASGDGSGPGPVRKLEQLLWLRVQPGTVVLDATFGLAALDGRLRQVRLAADPRLRLLPMEGPEAPSVRTENPREDVQILTLSYPQPIGGTQSLRTRFLLTGTSGVGSLRLPRLEVLDAEPSRRWLAVSVDPSLRTDDPDPDRASAIAVPQFLSAWGTKDGQPRFVDDLERVEGGWELVAQPRSPRVTAEYNLALGFGAKAVAVRLAADLNTSGGYSFQHRLEAPKRLDIESVSVLQEGAQRVQRWARGPDGQITVFLSAPVEGRHQLMLRGKVRGQIRGRWPVPQVRVRGADSDWSTLEVYRRPEVQVRPGKTSGLVEIEAPAVLQNGEDWGRLVRSYAFDDREPLDAEVLVTPNQAQMQATQITSLKADGETWEASVDLSVRVSRGLVDELRLEAPPSWQEPFRSDAPVSIRLVEASEGGRRQLVLRPDRAIEDEYRLRVTGRLAGTSGQNVTVPEILLREAESLKRFLVLPTQKELQPIAWETRGLHPSGIPDEFAVFAVGPDAFTAFRVVQDGFHAALKPLDAKGLAPQVRLSDIRLAWDPDQTCHGVATFYVDPAGEKQCPLTMPDGLRAVHVLVEGRAVLPRATERGDAYSVPLRSPILPQKVEVVFVGRIGRGEEPGLWRFPAPRVGNWGVRATLWRIAAPPGYSLGESEGVGRVSRLRQELYRMKAIADAMTLALESSAIDPEDLKRWHVRWASEIEACRTEVRRELSLPLKSDLHRTVRADLQAIEVNLARLAEMRGVAERDPAAAGGRTADCSELWVGTIDRSPALCRSVVHGPSDAIGLRYGSDPPVRVAPRWTAAGVVALATVLGLLASLWPAVASGLRRWPHLLAGLLGLAWWLWLQPSVIGWIIVVGAVITSIRASWRPRPRLPTLGGWRARPRAG